MDAVADDAREFVLCAAGVSRRSFPVCRLMVSRYRCPVGREVRRWHQARIDPKQLGHRHAISAHFLYLYPHLMLKLVQTIHMTVTNTVKLAMPMAMGMV